MSFSSKRLAAAFVTSLLVFASATAIAAPRKRAHPAPAAAAPAAAQPQPQAGQPQGPIVVDLKPTQPNWTKVCGHDQVANKDICYTTRDFGQAPGQPPVLALAVYDVKGDDTKIVRLLLPVALMLRPGFRFSVDKGAILEGNFEICFPNGCFAESRVRAATIDALKKGAIMNISVKNQVNNDVTFGVPLEGFGKAFDGPAVDPKVLQAQQQQLQAELQKRAEEERKRLEAQQAGNAAAANGAGAAKK
jgi:invasion protein IalB